METYLRALDKNPKVKEQCERSLTVSISRFFRDRGLWQVLENQILPGIVETHQEEIKVWFAGCACGEEVYSLAILRDRLKDRFEGVPRMDILATDMNPLYLDKAKARVFSRSSLKEVPVEIRNKYFRERKDGKQYQLLPFIIDNMTWERHNLLKDPPDQGFHLVFLRNNILTYYRDPLKSSAVKKVVECLTPRGFFVIGSHETRPPELDHLMSFSGYSYIFQK